MNSKEPVPILAVLRVPAVGACAAAVILAATTMSMLEPVLALHLQMLGLMARFVPELFAGFTRQLDRPTLADIHNRIAEAFARFDRVAAEATHERITRISANPDQGPLLRTLLRLRHDIIIIGRAAVVPLPDPLLPRLAPCLARVSESVADYLRASAAGLSARQTPPSLDRLEAALDGYAAEFSVLRREGFTRALAEEAVERIFALGFALDQLRLHLRDLARCVAELAQTDGGAVANVGATPEGAGHR